MKPSTLFLLLVLFLSACTGLRQPNVPQTAEEHRQRAEELIFSKNYSAAAEELALAIRKSPRQGDIYLRHGEVLAALGESREAGNTYIKGLRAVSKDSPHRRELTYRLALLYATDLNAPKKAQKLLDELPAGSIAFYDLTAVIATGRGNAREALALLNKALRQKPTKNMAAQILFHAAKAYQLLDDKGNVSKSLFQAINLAENLALTQDIEAFWKELNSERATETEH
jgi:tetratricopeptide (TPR) repeat protein